MRQFLLILFAMLTCVACFESDEKLLTRANSAFEAGDYEQAFKWIEKAAQRGLVQGEYNLAVLHYQGLGTPQNYPAALKWYTKAAESGDVDAQFNVAYMHYLGDGTPINYVKAYAWASMALASAHQNSEPLGTNIEDHRQFWKSMEETLSSTDKIKAQQLLGNIVERTNKGG